jgi:hypothetical protein
MRRVSSQRVRTYFGPALLVAAALCIAAQWGMEAYAGWTSPLSAYRDVDLKTIGNFAFDPVFGTVADVPPRSRTLDRRRVVIEGFMHPRDGLEGRTEFALVNGVPARRGGHSVQQRVAAHLKAGTPTPVDDPSTLVRVYGVLHVRVIHDRDGVLHSIYDMDVEQVEPVDAAASESGFFVRDLALLKVETSTFACVGLVGLLVWWVRQRNGRRRGNPTAVPCAACGYDLRAGHTRCPECGANAPRVWQWGRDTKYP